MSDLQINDAQLKEGLAVAERFCDLAAASADPSDQFVGDRMVGYILHLMGEHARARPRIERMLHHYAAPITGPRIIRFIFDQRAAAQAVACCPRRQNGGQTAKPPPRRINSQRKNGAPIAAVRIPIGISPGVTSVRASTSAPARRAAPRATLSGRSAR